MPGHGYCVCEKCGAPVISDVLPHICERCMNKILDEMQRIDEIIKKYEESKK